MNRKHLNIRKILPFRAIVRSKLCGNDCIKKIAAAVSALPQAYNGKLCCKIESDRVSIWRTTGGLNEFSYMIFEVQEKQSNSFTRMSVKGFYPWPFIALFFLINSILLLAVAVSISIAIAMMLSRTTQFLFAPSIAFLTCSIVLISLNRIMYYSHYKERHLILSVVRAAIS